MFWAFVTVVSCTVVLSSSRQRRAMNKAALCILLSTGVLTWELCHSRTAHRTLVYFISILGRHEWMAGPLQSLTILKSSLAMPMRSWSPLTFFKYKLALWHPLVQHLLTHHCPSYQPLLELKKFCLKRKLCARASKKHPEMKECGSSGQHA